ncbi:MAG: hypothetical protein DMG17_31235, partial [Acidobacteria bacterium]
MNYCAGNELAFILSKLELVVKCYDCSGVNVMKRTLPFLFGFLCFPPAFTYAQAGRNFDAVQVETKQVQGNIYMLVGAGGNVTVQVGADGVLLVDTQFAPMAPKILAAVRKLSDKPIIALSDPSKVKGRTYIIPGHGRLCDREDVIKYRDMSVILQKRVQEMINKGMTLKQVQAAKPTWDYEPLY